MRHENFSARLLLLLLPFLLAGALFLPLAQAAQLPAATTAMRYVDAATGSDASDCTDPGNPCATIGHALAQTVAGDTVAIAAGTYVENLVITHNVTLAGGYEAISWTRDLDLYETIVDGSAGATIPGDWDGDGVRYPMVLDDGGGVGGRFKMYYVGSGPAGGDIGVATSPDGLTWTRHPGNPVITASGWSADGMEAPFVLKEGSTAYKMWYSGFNEDGCGIGLATSSNGLDWFEHPDNPVLEPGSDDWNNNCVFHPVVSHDGTQYEMWLLTIGGGGSGTPSFAFATSPDGIDWTWHPNNPRFNLDPGNAWEAWWMWRPMVLHQSASDPYELWYTGFGDGEASIGHATSSNGSDWVRFAGNPVLTGTVGMWDEGFVADPFVIAANGTYTMYYDSEVSIGLATSPDGTTWTKYPGNPLLEPTTPTVFGQPVVTVDTDSLGAGLNDAVLDGLTITGGDSERGGGIIVGEEGGLTVRDCLIVANNAYDDGGGIALLSNADVILENGAVMSNTSQTASGGGLIAYDGTTVDISGTLFAENSARGQGGGLKTQGDGVLVTIRNATFQKNRTIDGEGAGLAITSTPTATIEDTDVFSNTAGWAGGGLLISGGTAIIDGAHLAYNQASGWGGGAWFTGADVTMTDSLVEHNVTLDGSAAGLELNSDWGPAYLALEDVTLRHNEPGGLHLWQATADINSSLFLENLGDGGINVEGQSELTLTGSTIQGNTTGGEGGGIRVSDQSAATITACIVSANLAETGEGGGVLVGNFSTMLIADSWVVGNRAAGNDGGGVATNADSLLTVENSIIAGNDTVASGGGVWMANSGPTLIVNTDIVGNEAGQEGAAMAAIYTVTADVLNSLLLFNTGNTGLADRDSSGSVFNLDHCDTFGNSPDAASGITINRTNCLGTPPETGVDPELRGGALPAGTGPTYAAAWLAYNYRLPPLSPAVDAGTLLGAPPDDIEGTLRDGLPDLGAYEYVLQRQFLPTLLLK